jgi:hypothetical protein
MKWLRWYFNDTDGVKLSMKPLIFAPLGDQTRPDSILCLRWWERSYRRVGYKYHRQLTPRSTALPEKSTGSQLVKKLPAFYGTRMFNTVFTSAQHLSLSWAKATFTIPMIMLLRIIRLDAKSCRDVGILRKPASVLDQMLRVFQLNKTGHKSHSAIYVSELHKNISVWCQYSHLLW